MFNGLDAKIDDYSVEFNRRIDVLINHQNSFEKELHEYNRELDFAVKKFDQ